MRSESPKKLYPLRDACKALGVSYPALKQWIYKGKIKTVKLPAGTTAFQRRKSTVCFPLFRSAVPYRRAEKISVPSAAAINWWAVWLS